MTAFRAGLLLLVGAAVVAVSAAGPVAAGTGRSATRCPRGGVSRAYLGSLAGVLQAGRDVWGTHLIRSAGGPSYEAVRQYLRPLLLAGHPPGQRSAPLTDSGVYYLPFALPRAPADPGPVALHLADGSEIVSERSDGARLVLAVGRLGSERYGSCSARLGAPALAAGYLPILETHYVDADGVSYRQESFTARVAEPGWSLSFVRLSIEPRRASGARVLIRFTPSLRGLGARDGALVRGDRAYVFFSAGGRFDGSSLDYRLDSSRHSTIYLAWALQPAPRQLIALDAAAYARARRSAIGYWQQALGRVPFLVPERRVVDAERSLLIQNLEMGWRYSLGNAYQEFEYPESLDAVSVMGEYGFAGLEEATLVRALKQPLALYPNWEIGTKLNAVAAYVRRFGNRRLLASATPSLRRYLDDLAGQLSRSRFGLLRPERWASDLPEVGYALDSEAVVWQGLMAIADVWNASGRLTAARRARALSVRLGDGLRRAVRASETRLPDGSLFVPIELYSHQPPYRVLPASRDGSYWNLTIPYALASGLFAPGGSEAKGLLRYLLGHGSRLLGLVRNAAYSLSPDARAAVPGTDDVYLLDTARFLADNDQADQLVLSLYGQLAAGMAAGTFVSGESATLAPAPGQSYRSMYLPPNSASNAAFLETLRLTLLHERVDHNGRPRGLDLAFATPRAWLRPGASIGVDAAPTSFGPVSYTLSAQQHTVRAVLSIPSRTALRSLRLRLRLPDGRTLRAVTLDGKPFTHFDARAETIDLSGNSGTLTLIAAY